MKELTLILSLIFLVLSATPCLDGCTEDQHNDEISCVNDHNHQEKDECPAICVCSCCGITITHQIGYVFNLKQKIYTEVFSIYSSNYQFHFQSNIWQPPQLIS